jgi:chaperonin GroEL (HSP60 family)
MPWRLYPRPWLRTQAWTRVVEPLRVKTQAINSAADAAIMILRIDDVIASKSGGPGGMGGEDFE